MAELSPGCLCEDSFCLLRNEKALRDLWWCCVPHYAFVDFFLSFCAVYFYKGLNYNLCPRSNVSKFLLSSLPLRVTLTASFQCSLIFLYLFWFLFPHSLKNDHSFSSTNWTLQRDFFSLLQWNIMLKFIGKLGLLTGLKFQVIGNLLWVFTFFCLVEFIWQIP